MKGFAKSAVALGNFDGVHKAHEALIRDIVSVSKLHNLKSTVYTFSEHPKTVLSEEPVKIITPNDIKEEIIKALGVDTLYFQPLTKDILSTSPRDFVKNILLDRLNASYVAVGFNYRFGKDAEGDPNLLKEMGIKYGFEVKIIDKVSYGGHTISSTYIRELLNAGDIEKVNLLSTQNFKIRGKVIHGKKLGREIGFPTVNINCPDYVLLPKNGVYLSEIHFDGKKLNGVTNVGANPTVEKILPRVESHILDFNGDLYGKTIDVTLIKRLRDEICFKNVNELKTQISQDILNAKNLLN